MLDIGAWDGVFTFEAERRGASRVLATDSYCWSGEGWGTKGGFLTASRILGSSADDLEIDVMDRSPDRSEVRSRAVRQRAVYHLRYPLLALERVASVTGDQLIFDSHAAKGEDFDPVMLF